ncbi:hypothetical protein HT031_005549 [Scenedesmus sp. PABB004]|nr:hypothetical protein HT031_005549 [Scenedesmus sp. PABB004]
MDGRAAAEAPLVALLHQELRQERAARSALQQQLWGLQRAAAAPPCRHARAAPELPAAEPLLPPLRVATPPPAAARAAALLLSPTTTAPASLLRAGSSTAASSLCASADVAALLGDAAAARENCEALLACSAGASSSSSSSSDDGGSDGGSDGCASSWQLEVEAAFCRRLAPAPDSNGGGRGGGGGDGAAGCAGCVALREALLAAEVAAELATAQLAGAAEELHLLSLRHAALLHVVSEREQELQRGVGALGALVGALLLALAAGEAVLPLDGREWRLTNGNGSVSLTTTLPAYPLEVLRANGLIGDPLYRYGEQDSRWVAYEVWRFAVEISAAEAAALAAQEQVVLFLAPARAPAPPRRHWTVPVKGLLSTSRPNTLAITIQPAYNKSLEYQAAHDYYIPTLYNTGSIGAYNFVRKPAFDFGWDWGPAFAASGIHGTVKLIAFSKPTLAGAYVAQAPAPGGFNLKVTAQFLVPGSGGEGALTVALPELGLVSEQEVEFGASPDNEADLFEASAELFAPAGDVTLWWPAGGDYGPHKLYDVTLDFAPAGADCGEGAATAAGQPGAAGAGLSVDLDLGGGSLGLDVSVGGGAAAAPAALRGAVAARSDCSVLRKRTGFRTVELVRQPLPVAVEALFGNNTGFTFAQGPKILDGILTRTGEGQWANDADGRWTHFPGNDSDVEGAVPESYYLRINGLPIFMKGANVIPMSVLPANVTPALIRSTLRAAVESNQNLLRVWGGGLYHTEEFYDFCDENGLLIWQDAMFGGSHYPRNPAFLENVAEEITQQARRRRAGAAARPGALGTRRERAAAARAQAERLSWHPSVAVWCGNNELELSYEWGNNTLVNPRNIFVSSSPTKGPAVDTPDDFVLRWGWIGDTRYGSVHHYDYLSDCEDFRSYPTAKFVTEFGWQSYPMPETYAASMRPEDDWGVGNPMNEFRNRRTDVTPQFLHQYGLHFRLPADWNPDDPAERLERFQARTRGARTRGALQSLTMGVMYWQLNDIWAGASWSSVDVAGRFKPVHYAVKRAYAPLAVQAIRDNATVDIFVVSDLTSAVTVDLKLQLVSLNDSADTCTAAVVAEQTVVSLAARVPGLFASKVWSSSVAALFALRPGCTPSTCFLSASTSGVPGAGPSYSQLWLSPFKAIDLPEPGLVIEDVVPVGPEAADITLSAARPAALVLLSEVHPLLGHFDDNAFSMNPCERRVVRFISQAGPVTPAALSADGAFYVESLADHSAWSGDAPGTEGTAALQEVPATLLADSAAAGAAARPAAAAAAAALAAGAAAAALAPEPLAAGAVPAEAPAAQQ